jgi:ribosome-associated translation inhibitor RaiA
VIDVETHADSDIPRSEVDAARRRLATLDDYVDEPLLSARLTLRRVKATSDRGYVADASVSLNGRLVAAHTTGRSVSEAADTVAERLRRQVRRTVGAQIALRNEPRVIGDALAALGPEVRYRPETRLKPPEERAIVHRRPYLDVPLSTLEAAAELLDTDIEFLLFRHVRTGEDVVVHRRDGDSIGLLFPPGSALADENDVVVPEPSRYDGPRTLSEAREEMDLANHRFLYFIDAADGRGKVLYLRHDGDYGLVEPGGGIAGG